MGFVPDETLYKLTWEDPAMAGLEVTVREPSIDQLMAMAEMGSPDARTADPAQVRAVFKVFAGLLDSWNVETRDGTPVPVTYEGVISQSPAFVTKIITAMNKEFTRADPTSPSGSRSGATMPGPLEASIPMEPMASPGSS